MRVLLVLLLVGCGEGGDLDAGSGDAGTSLVDSGMSDAGSVGVDGGPSDAGTSDAGAHDAGMTDAGMPASPCTEFADGIENGGVPLDELSGLAVSRRNVGLIYAHDDSGGEAAVYAMNESAQLRATLNIDNATNDDYEDIAVGPGGDGQSWVWVGDIGDNDARTGGGSPRSSIVVYRFPEPALDPTMTTTRTVTAEALRFTYPDRPHDCESLAVDPDTGDLYFLTKENSSPATLFVARAPHAASTRTLELVGTVALTLAVGMDMSPTGGGLLVRYGGGLSLFLRNAGEDWSDAVARAAIRVPVELEPQGEAVAWALDGRGYWTASEGSGEPLYFYGATDPECSAP
jgi:hypothetical protein